MCVLIGITENNMILLKNIELYTPAYLGKKDVLIGGTKVLLIEDKVKAFDGVEEVIDCSGLKAIPGLIDAHTHLSGAGGEGGPLTRTPEMPLELLIEAGVTSVVACLGTDGITRNPESVLMKVKAAHEFGLNAWMYTGAYQVPTPTFFGDAGKDIALIDEVIGVGEIAISDHRSSHASIDELTKLASHARVGGMLGGKAGIVNLHMGDAKNPFDPIEQIVSQSELGYRQFLPTHCNRNDYIFEDAKTYGKRGYVDITTSSYPYFPQYEIKPAKALKELLNAGVPIEHITFTSDANGSLPDFNEKGELVQLETGKPNSILHEIRDAVLEEGLPIETAIRVATSSIASILKLKSKGIITKNHDADLLILDKGFNPVHVFSNGAILMKDGKIQKWGYFSRKTT